jgi:hypothetical protein
MSLNRSTQSNCNKYSPPWYTSVRKNILFSQESLFNWCIIDSLSSNNTSNFFINLKCNFPSFHIFQH